MNQITKKCIIISFITGIIASVLMWLFSEDIARYCLHNRVSKKVIHMICYALPFIAMSSALNGYFTAVRKVYKNMITRFFEQLVKITATSYILSLFFPIGLEYACYSLILGDVISEIASFVLQYLLYLYEKRRNFRALNHKSYTKRILRVSLPIAFTSYIRSGLYTIKQVLIPDSLEKSGLSCSDALSKYGTITGMVMPILMFPCIFVDSFSTLLIPEYSRYFVKKDGRKIKKVTMIVLIFTFLLSVFFTMIFFFFADTITFLIYHDLEIGGYVKILSLAIPFIYIDIVIDCILKGLDEQVKVVAINVIDLVVNVIFIYFLVPIYGFTGYLVSIFMSEILNFILSGFVLLRFMKKIKKDM